MLQKSWCLGWWAKCGHMWRIQSGQWSFLRRGCKHAYGQGIAFWRHVLPRWIQPVEKDLFLSAWICMIQTGKMPFSHHCPVFCYRWWRIRRTRLWQWRWHRRWSIFFFWGEECKRGHLKVGRCLVESELHTLQATQIGSIADSVAILHSSSVVQTTLRDYIS